MATQLHKTRYKILFITTFVMIVILITTGSIAKESPVQTQLTQYPEVKIALLGDTEAGAGFGSVLALVASEKSDVVMINGDFGYGSSPQKWTDRLLKSIDINTHAIIGSLGNHDRGKNTNTYIAAFESFRTPANGLKNSCTGKAAIKKDQDTILIDEVCTFGNVTVVANGIGQAHTKSYLETRLDKKLKDTPLGNWKLVGYHYTLPQMNPGLKSSVENTYNFFDIIRRHGAIGAQAHTHSVMASCPIISPFTSGGIPKCHQNYTNFMERFITPGTGLYIDSSLGGKEARARKRCKLGTETDCIHMSDLITEEGYTRADGLTLSGFDPLGALFIVFNSGGDPLKAHAYYKSIDGREIFKFNIKR